MAKKKSTSTSKVTLDDSIRVLLVHGKESFLLRHHLDELRKAIEQMQPTVEVLHFDGSNASVADVLDEVRSFGLLGQYRIVVIDEADQFVKGDDRRPILERYAENPVDHATLVLRSNVWHRGKLDKAIAKVGAIIKCDEAKPAEAAQFCMTRAVDVHQTSITLENANALIELIGTDLSRLDSELGRLAVAADPENGITRELIDRETVMTREEQAWVLQQAILSAGPAEGMAKVHELMEISNQPAALLHFCFSDLAKKIFAVARLREEGAPESALDGVFQRWDRSKYAIQKIAGNRTATEWASLMADSMWSPVRTRTSLGDDERAIEMLAVRFLGMIHRLDR